MSHKVTHHKSNGSHIDHSGLLQEVMKKSREIYFGFQLLESPKSIDKRVEEFILQAISGKGKSGVEYFQGLLHAYYLLEFHKESEKLALDHEWYNLQENKLSSSIKEAEEYLIGVGFIDNNSRGEPSEKDQWGFLGDITQRVHEQLSE